MPFVLNHFLLIHCSLISKVKLINTSLENKHHYWVRKSKVICHYSTNDRETLCRRLRSILWHIIWQNNWNKIEFFSFFHHLLNFTTYDIVPSTSINRWLFAWWIILILYLCYIYRSGCSGLMHNLSVLDIYHLPTTPVLSRDGCWTSCYRPQICQRFFSKEGKKCFSACHG